jgi:glycosyltransferase involved in cell wall biosynthesis
MKKILLISYMFPPIAGAGTQRPLKFVKYLPDFGIEPVVFCPKEASWRANDPKSIEYPFLKKTRIYRCGIQRLKRYFDLRFNRGLVNHPHFYLLALKYIWFMDFQSAWYFECRKELLKIAKKEKVDCILTTSPPHSVHFFGMNLKKKLGVPWVMDLRDAIFDEPNRDYSRFINSIQTPIKWFYEKKFYRHADAIVSVSQPILDSICIRHSSIDCKKKTHLITNGYDAEDFRAIKPISNQTDCLVVTYTGSFLGKRTPEYFLKALLFLIDQNKVNPSDIIIRFVGYFDEKLLSIIEKYSSTYPIQVIGFQPYEKALAYQAGSDLLLLVVGVREEEGGNQIFTGKLFEYLGANRPVIALAPNGPLKETIEKGRFGTVAPPKDIPKIAETFKCYYDQWKKEGTLSFNPDLELRKCFERKRLTEKLASIVENPVSTHRNQLQTGQISAVP